MNSNPFEFITYILDNDQQFLKLLTEHIWLTVASILLGIVIALPLAILASRVKILAAPLTWLAGVGQTIPSLAVLALMMPVLGIGFGSALVALTIRAILPIFLNTYIGIRDADAAVIEAARGMGASNLQRLLMVELPLASPVMFAGVQTAIVQNIGIATLAAYIGGGGLGDLILQGLAGLETPILLAGAVPIAALAMIADILMSRLSRVVVPVGLRIDTAI